MIKINSEYLENHNGWRVFDTEEFLDSVHEDDYEFVNQMINTQHFTSFIDKIFKVHNNLLRNNEIDSEKIKFFLKWLNILHNSNHRQLRVFLETNIILSINDYLNKEIIKIENFSNSYFNKLTSNFLNGMTPKIHLLQQSLAYGDNQMSIITELNENLIIKDIELPFKLNWNKQLTIAPINKINKNAPVEISRVSTPQSSRIIENNVIIFLNKLLMCLI